MNFNSNNPFLKNDKYKKDNPDFAQTSVSDREDSFSTISSPMTMQGTINKSFILLGLLLVGAFGTWYLAAMGFNPIVLTIGGAVVALILCLVSAFKPQYSSKLAPGYAIFEGLFIGGISSVFEMMYPGIVIQAVLATFVTFIICLGLFKYNIVKVNETFKSVVVASTLAIGTYYLIAFIAKLAFGFQPFHHGNSLMSIGFSAFVIILASLNLFLDFDLISKSVKERAPKYMEWYSAMGLLVTLVWLYIEFLRLISKLSSRD